MTGLQIQSDMLDELKLENLLFLDIETVPMARDFSAADPRMKDLWDKKSSHFRNDDESASDVWPRASIYAEFGKIICISAGIFSQLKDPKRFRIKSFTGDDEGMILDAFSTLVQKFRPARDIRLCAHNGKEFDFPYICRRLLIMGRKIPAALQVAGKKPWELNFIDTLDLWKFGEYRNYASLSLLTEVLGLADPKDDMDGSQVAGVYYDEGDMARITAYCEKDVLAVAQVLLRFCGEHLIPEENVEIVQG